MQPFWSLSPLSRNLQLGEDGIDPNASYEAWVL